MAKKKKGKAQPEGELKRLLLRVVVIPAIALFMILVVGGTIGTLFNSSTTTTYVIAGVGIVVFLVYYFRNELRRFVSRR